ncbi:hypothetical protein WICMUC_005540 [Wickerhamomyces mucosus]|uniref:Uncharacterized protein n=1 Tax=Wickerhamomyces mucosus TaxID=1378264 RepID=A0A9P8T583_9ASCO|nr:hypothetical protein WICMUC_005540 [Wickerhamomyces mucosus]
MSHNSSPNQNIGGPSGQIRNIKTLDQLKSNNPNFDKPHAFNPTNQPGIEQIKQEVLKHGPHPIQGPGNQLGK